MRIVQDVESLIYRSYMAADHSMVEKDDRTGRRPELARALLDRIGQPDHNLEVVLVTGSKGKGSTAKMIASLLQAHGKRVGLFTSPHLVTFRERIRVNGEMIDEASFIRLGGLIEPIVDDLAPLAGNGAYLSPIAVSFAIAMAYFHEQKVDVCVVECGRGGRFDDTNVVKNRWAVITPIMAEHVENLGPDMEQIAYHKAGIVKECTERVVLGAMCCERRDLLTRHFDTEQVSSYALGVDFSAGNICVSGEGTSFFYRRNGLELEVSLPLLGGFQAENAAVALTVCEEIIGRDPDEEAVAHALGSLQWPGRMEVVQQHPLTILDGVIHRETAQRFCETIRELEQHRSLGRVTVIVGVPADKDYRGVIDVMSGLADQLIVTKPDVTHHPFPADALVYAQTKHPDCAEGDTLSEALQLVRDADTLLIVGIQQLIGHAKRLFST